MSGHRQLQIHQRLDVRPVEVKDTFAKIKQAKRGHDPDDAQHSGMHCFDAFLRTLEHWWEEITNFFIERANSGFVEGFNNKIKVLKRRCYGIFNLTHLFQRIFLDLEGYRLFAS